MKSFVSIYHHPHQTTKLLSLFPFTNKQQAIKEIKNKCYWEIPQGAIIQIAQCPITFKKCEKFHGEAGEGCLVMRSQAVE
jgi:hypothetical protein